MVPYLPTEFMVQEMEVSEESEDDSPPVVDKKTPEKEKHVKAKKLSQVQFKWIGEGTKVGQKTFYEGKRLLKIGSVINKTGGKNLLIHRM